MELKILFVFDGERFWRSGKLDLDFLPSSAGKMPENISGTWTWQDDDVFTIEQSKTRRAIFNLTQVEYDLELSNDRERFTARRRRL